MNNKMLAGVINGVFMGTLLIFFEASVGVSILLILINAVVFHTTLTLAGAYDND